MLAIFAARTGTGYALDYADAATNARQELGSFGTVFSQIANKTPQTTMSCNNPLGQPCQTPRLSPRRAAPVSVAPGQPRG